MRLVILGDFEEADGQPGALIVGTAEEVRALAPLLDSAVTVRAADWSHPLDRRLSVDVQAHDATAHALEIIDQAAQRVSPQHWLWDLRELLDIIHYDYTRR